MNISFSKNFEDLTVVIVLYNHTDLIFNLLQKLQNLKIIIVDNGKNDKIINKLKSYKNISKIISKNKNIGYGKAINFAFNYIDSKFFLILNPDIEITEESISNLLNVIKKYNSAGVAPITIPDKDFYGIFPEKGKGIKRNSNEKKSSEILNNSKIEGPCSVDVAKGCAMLLNSKHFKQVGMFDEKYFLFWEEIDLCRKIRKNKFSFIITPNSTAKHKESGSVKKGFETFFLRNYHHELSPLIYFKVRRFSKLIIWRLLKYIFRTFTYLLVLNFRKSSINFLKFLATLKYSLGIYG